MGAHLFLLPWRWAFDLGRAPRPKEQIRTIRRYNTEIEVNNDVDNPTNRWTEGDAQPKK